MQGHNEQPQDFWYLNNYNRINATAISGGIYSRILHKFLELPSKLLKEKTEGISILEVGANIGEHIPYVQSKWKNYTATDIREPQEFQLEEIRKMGANFQVADVESLPFRDELFDRVIATCVFHHLENPENGFKEIRRVLKNQGSISILLPNDPGILYRILWKFTTLRNAGKSGLAASARINHARQHRNHYLGLMILLRENFKEDKIRVIGLPFIFRSYSLNILTVVYIKK
jgi:phosphatidylethanolamine/phosphatidyl-N-methylethanolamine N-methyltransferase